MGEEPHQKFDILVFLLSEESNMLIRYYLNSEARPYGSFSLTS